MNTTAVSDIPNAHFESRREYHPTWIVLTACRVDSADSATVEMNLTQWFNLAPVQYVIKLELSRQQPRRPSAIINTSPAALPVPRGHIEWKNGQNWVVLTAYRSGTQEATTVEMTLGQWFALKPVRFMVADRLDRWRDRASPTW